MKILNLEKLFFSIFLLLSFYSNATAQEFYIENWKFGLKDATGNILITAKYDTMEFIDNDLIVVSINEKLGLLTQNGKEIVTPKYDDISDFKEGFAFVKQNRKNWLYKYIWSRNYTNQI